MKFLFSAEQYNFLYYIGLKKNEKHSIIKFLVDDGTISHSDAKKFGLKHYFTNKKCKYGHLCIRYVSSGCMLCLRAKRRNYKKPNTVEYQKKERARRRKNYWEHRERHLEKRRDNRRKNPAATFARRCLERTLSTFSFGHTDYFAILGYKREDLVSHLELLFTEGMSWDNHGEWHIDHIKPIKQFIVEGITDPRIINALSNLQPLWAKDNLKKGAKYE